ncbi:hypothetical protein STEG23_024610, partial [Scotinomys teguina]
MSKASLVMVDNNTSSNQTVKQKQRIPTKELAGCSGKVWPSYHMTPQDDLVRHQRLSPGLPDNQKREPRRFCLCKVTLGCSVMVTVSHKDDNGLKPLK